MSALLLRPLGFGEILDGAFTMYRRHFAALFATALIAMVPISAASGLWIRSLSRIEAADAFATVVLWAFPLMVLGGLTMLAGWAALTRQVGQAIEGWEVSVGDAYATGLRTLVPVAVAGVLAYAAVFAVAMALMMGVGLAAALVAAFSSPIVSGALIVVAILATLLVVLAMAAAFFAIVPVIVLERSGPLAALVRSWRLSRGARLRIIGVLLVSWLIIMLPWVGVMLAAGMGASIYDAEAAATLPTSQFVFQQVLGIFSGALTFPFWVACVTLLYYDRRVRSEAFDLEAAADKLALAD